MQTIVRTFRLFWRLVSPRLGSRLSTKWGAFAVNSLQCMQAACIRQHADSTVHRVAQNLYLSPDKPINELLPYDLGRQELFRGNVPQAKDWLRAWSACFNPIAFNSAEKHYEAEDYGLGRPCSVTRRGFLVDASERQASWACFSFLIRNWVR